MKMNEEYDFFRIYRTHSFWLSCIVLMFFKIKKWLKSVCAMRLFPCWVPISPDYRIVWCKILLCAPLHPANNFWFNFSRLLISQLYIAHSTEVNGSESTCGRIQIAEMSTLAICMYAYYFPTATSTKSFSTTAMYIVGTPQRVNSHFHW